MKTIVFLLLITIATPTVAAETLGRLFFTREQRVLLDNARKQKIKLAEEPEPNPVAAADPPPPPPPRQDVSVNGLVKRSDGGSTVWINNRPVDGKSFVPGVERMRVESQGKVTVKIPDSAQTIKLRVGQHFEGYSGAIKENYLQQVRRIEPNVEEPAVEELDVEESDSLNAEEPDPNYDVPEGVIREGYKNSASREPTKPKITDARLRKDRQRQ